MLLYYCIILFYPLQFTLVLIASSSSSSSSSSSASPLIPGRRRSRSIWSSLKSSSSASSASLNTRNSIDTSQQYHNTDHRADTVDTTPTTITSRNDDEEKEDGLVFEGTFEYESDIIPIPTKLLILSSSEGEGRGRGGPIRSRNNHNDHTITTNPPRLLLDFFLDRHHRDLAIKGGGNECKCIPNTPELYQEWSIQSKLVNSTPPTSFSSSFSTSNNGGNNHHNIRNNNDDDDNDENEEILAIYSTVPIVPGLALRATSIIGCKTMLKKQQPGLELEPEQLVVPSKSRNGGHTTTSNGTTNRINDSNQLPLLLPYYEFTTLQESYEPVGKKTMTWIFNKITGTKNDNNNTANSNSSNNSSSKRKIDSSSSSSSTCVCRVMLQQVAGHPQEQNDAKRGCKLCYYGHVKLRLSQRFLHMLPLPKSIVQKKVNHSIQKQLQKECIASVTKFTHVMQDWIATDPQSSSISDDNNKSEQKTERTTSHSNV